METLALGMTEREREERENAGRVDNLTAECVTVFVLDKKIR